MKFQNYILIEKGKKMTKFREENFFNTVNIRFIIYILIYTNKLRRKTLDWDMLLFKKNYTFFLNFFEFIHRLQKVIIY